MTAHRTVFDEHHFTWPTPPGNPKKEAKLPWFWFIDVGEAKAYVSLFWTVQSLGFVLVLNFWFFKSYLLFYLVFPVAMLAQICYLRIWIGLCKRAQPPPGRIHWFFSGWGNPRTWHCLLVARDLIQDDSGDKAKAPKAAKASR